MSTIKPFSAVRPKPAYAARVAALPYDVMNSAEARQKVQGNPYSFLHVDKAEVDLPEDTDGILIRVADMQNQWQAQLVCQPDLP